MESAKWLQSGVEDEFAGATLGDERRTRRLQRVAQRLSAEPAKSFPQTFETKELEGFYRFLRSEYVKWESILEPHLAASYERAASIGECLVVHDTTEFQFTGRESLGTTTSSAKGFFAHFSLFVAMDSARTPLGVAGLQQYEREGRDPAATRREVVKDPQSEGRRWLRAVQTVESRVASRFRCIHVADREGDMFELMAGAAEVDASFVIRATYDRRIIEDDEDARLHDPLMRVKPAITRTIQISKRGKSLTPKMTRKYPVRGSREAEVAMAGTTVTLVRPYERGHGPDLEVNIVRIWEPKPPAGEDPIEWLLYTSEAIESADDLERIVDIYRARWTIEEYFKALKTGCAMEKRQLESFDTLTNAVCIFAPIAWRLLLVRSVARAAPDEPAARVLSPTQIRILELKLKCTVRTAKDAFLAVARLGGHLKQNGEPGWQTLARGFEELLIGEYYFSLGQSAARSDQS